MIGQGILPAPSLLQLSSHEMKGFPPTVEGPLGPWHQKVNATVACAQLAATPAELRQILGEADTIEIESAENRREYQEYPLDERYCSEYWNYVDPYRPRMKYRFGISAGRIIFRSRVTQSTHV